MSLKRSVTTPLGNEFPVNPLRVYAARAPGNQLRSERDDRADERALAGSALDDQASVEGVDAVGEAAQAGAAAGVRAADSVVRDLDDRVAVRAGDADARERCARVLRDVR